ncbi:MAG: hypothetical protein WCX69_02920 [Candidatus Paceibacterota bacterium]
MTMIEKLSEDQFRELYMKLPDDLKDAVFAPETGENIEAICERNRIPQTMDFLIKGIGDVYLGLLPPADFFAALEKQLEGENGIKQIILEINNFLLYRYRNSLENIYKLESAPQAAIPAATPAAWEATEQTNSKTPPPAAATTAPEAQNQPPV